MLKALVFYLLLPFLYLLAWLPFPVMHGLSNVLYLLVYYLFGYRKQVVMENLKRSFPEKTTEEITVIARKFYRHLCDLLLESFKTLSLSKRKMLQHAYFHPEALALFNQLAQEGKSTVSLMGHQGNWDWCGNAFAAAAPVKLFAIYRPLDNPYFDRLAYKMRTRFEGQPVPMNQTLRTLLANRQLTSTTAFIADQAPHPAGAYWTTFLHQDTPFFMGAEKIARKLNYPVLYISIHKEKRSRYQIRAEILVADPAQAAPETIMERYARRQEQDIRLQPEIWLWSHRRWKHRRDAKA